MNKWCFKSVYKLMSRPKMYIQKKRLWYNVFVKRTKYDACFILGKK